MQEPSFRVRDDSYPVPSRFRPLDPVLIRELTGLEWDEFADGLNRPGPGQVMGLLAVAVWHAHPDWSRGKVVRFVQQLEMEDFEFVDGDPRPPAQTETQQPGVSDDSTEAGEPGSGLSSAPTLTPPGSGMQGSGTGVT